MKFDIGEKKIFTNCVLEVFNKEIQVQDLKGISFDSRSIDKGDVFVAFNGENNDGHDYIEDSILNGASLIINEKFDDGDSMLKVDSSRNALKLLAMEYRSRMKCKVIAITGSNGKTTTKELLAHIMKSNFSLSYTKDNFNSTIGLPLSIFSISNSNDYFIAELGTNIKGEIKFLSDIAKPDFSVITNIAEAHLANFDTIEGVYEEKINLFKSLNEDGVAFMNMDDPFISSTNLYGKCKIVKFGFSNNYDYSAIYDEDSSEMEINGIKINIPQRSNLLPQNILMIFAISKELGVDLNNFNSRLKSFQMPNGRGNILSNNNYIVINDTYNSNFSSTISGLKQLSQYPSINRKIAILGDMLELGIREKEIHSNLSEHLVESGVKYIFTYGELMSNLYSSMKNNYSDIAIFHYTDCRELIKHVKKIIKNGDVLYVKGSRSMKMEKIVEEII